MRNCSSCRPRAIARRGAAACALAACVALALARVTVRDGGVKAGRYVSNLISGFPSGTLGRARRVEAVERDLAYFGLARSDV